MLYLIVGNTGAGKTTYAQKLKKENRTVLFSIDKWNNTLFFQDKKDTDGVDWILERIDRAERMMMDTIKQLESVGVDSLLDLGLSKKEHREKWRRFARDNGFKSQIHFLDIDRDTRRKRVTQRNNEKGDSFEFEVNEEAFNFMESWFETPDEAELEKAIIIKINA